MVVYIVKYVDTGRVVGIFEDVSRAVTFRHTRIEHYSHYRIIRRDLDATPTQIKSTLVDVILAG